MMAAIVLWLLVGALLPAGLAPWLYHRLGDKIEALAPCFYGEDRRELVRQTNVWRSTADKMERFRHPLFALLGPVPVVWLAYVYLGTSHDIRAALKAVRARDEALRRWRP